MKNKFTVTITNVYGSKHYTVDQIIKKIALIIAILLIALIVVGIVSFGLMKKELIDVQTKKETILQNIQTIEDKNNNLINEKKSLQNKILDEQKKLFKIEGKIRNIEGIIGIPRYKTWEDKTKIQKVTINKLQKYLLLKQIPIGYPIKYTRVTAPYGWREHPINKNREFHKGIDLKQKKGYAIKSPASGIVTYASFQGSKGYGNLVKIAHNFSFVSIYGHLNSIKVKHGQFVKKGDILGYVGSTGLSTGPHLHYEIKFLNKTVDPIDFIEARTKGLDKIFKNNRSIPWQEIINSLTNQKN